MGKMLIKKAIEESASNIKVSPEIRNPEILFLALEGFLGKSQIGFLSSPGNEINGSFLTDLEEKGWLATIFRSTGKASCDRPISSVNSGKWMYCFKNAALTNTEKYTEDGAEVTAGLTGGWWQASDDSEICFVMFAPDPRVLFRKRVITYYKDRGKTELNDVYAQGGDYTNLENVRHTEPFRILREMNQKTRALYDIPKTYARLFHNSIWVRYSVGVYLGKMLSNVYKYDPDDRVIGKVTGGGTTEEVDVNRKEGLMGKAGIKRGTYPFGTFGVTDPVDRFYKDRKDSYIVNQRGTIETNPDENGPLYRHAGEVMPTYQHLYGIPLPGVDGAVDPFNADIRYTTRAYAPIASGSRNWEVHPSEIPPVQEGPQDDAPPLTEPAALGPVLLPKNKRGLFAEREILDDQFVQQQIDEGKLTTELAEKLRGLPNWKSMATLDEVQSTRTGNENWSTTMFNSMLMKSASVALSFAKIMTQAELMEMQQGEDSSKKKLPRSIDISPGETLNYNDTAFVVNIVVKFPDGVKATSGADLQSKSEQFDPSAHNDMEDYDVDGNGSGGEIHIFIEKVGNEDGIEISSMFRNHFQNGLSYGSYAPKIEKSSGGLLNAEARQGEPRWKSYINSQIKALNNDIDDLIIKLNNYKVVFEEASRPQLSSKKDPGAYMQELLAYKKKLETYDLPKDITDIDIALKQHDGSFEGFDLASINFVKLIKD